MSLGAHIRLAACRGRRRAFTLIETALALVIIGVGVLALIEANQAFIHTNGWSTQAATATYLANEVREMMRRLPRHDPVTGLYFDSSSGSQVLRGWGPETGELGANDFNDVDDFDGLKFAYNGTTGMADGDLPGPIDAFGSIIPEIGNDGAIVLDAQGNPEPLQGWSQEVRVQKVSPFNPATTYVPSATLPPDGNGFTGLAVDKFPLKVTVTVKYRGVYDSADETIAVVTWIVP